MGSVRIVLRLSFLLAAASLASGCITMSGRTGDAVTFRLDMGSGDAAQASPTPRDFALFELLDFLWRLERPAPPANVPTS